MITERLELIPLTTKLCDAEAQGRDAVGRALRVRVPASWPPPVFEPDDLERLHRRLERDPASHAWTLYYLVLRTAVTAAPRELLGIAGYLGPPSAEGVVEIGYAIAAEYQRRGYATEAARALTTRAFADATVRAVMATTYATLVPSIGVLRKAGFALIGRDIASGLLQYEHRRDSGRDPRAPAS